MKTVKTDIQIRFADVDILGHVNNVNLQHYFDLGKNEYFKLVLSLSHTKFDKGVILASTQTQYMAQTRMNENIYVETGIEKIGNKSITMLQRVVSHDNGEVKAESRSIMVAFDFSNQLSIPVPDKWRTLAETFNAIG